MGGMSGQTPSGRPVVRKKVVHTDTTGGGGYQGSSRGTVVRKTVVRTGSSGGDYHDSAGGPVMRKSIVHTESVPVVKKTVHKSVTRTETVVTGIGNIWIEFIYRNWCTFLLIRRHRILWYFALNIIYLNYLDTYMFTDKSEQTYKLGFEQKYPVIESISPIICSRRQFQIGCFFKNDK